MLAPTPTGPTPDDMSSSTTPPPAVALAMAEALSLAIRGADRAAALRRLRACTGDPVVLQAAARACRDFDQVDEPVVRRAATWLESAARPRRRARTATGNMRRATPNLT